MASRTLYQPPPRSLLGHFAQRTVNKPLSLHAGGRGSLALDASTPPPGKVSLVFDSMHCQQAGQPYPRNMGGSLGGCWSLRFRTEVVGKFEILTDKKVEPKSSTTTQPCLIPRRFILQWVRFKFSILQHSNLSSSLWAWCSFLSYFL